MTSFPSPAPTPELAEQLPTLLPDPEQLVYDFVKAAAAHGIEQGHPSLSFYADRARAAAEGRRIDVVRGWPAYPGVVPAIGVAAGPETEDQQHEAVSGGFAGEVAVYEPLLFPANGAGLTLPVEPLHGTGIVGVADYYAEPLYSTVVVELIHENRDERDRLHDELRRVLFPLRSLLPGMDGQIRKCSVDAEKTEQQTGPPMTEQPMLIYISIFTVHVHYEMLQARDVTLGSELIERVDVTAEVVAE